MYAQSVLRSQPLMPVAAAAESRRWSAQQAAFIEACVNGFGSIVLEAVAGAGKTTTLLEAAKRMSGSTAICAFNKEIAIEIKHKLIEMGIDWKKAQAGTVHSFGFKALTKTFPNLVVDSYKVAKILEKTYAPDSIEFRYKDSILKLVSMAKQRALGLSESYEPTDPWLAMIEAYEIFDIDDERPPIDEVIKASRALLVASNAVTAVIDFDDMVYLPLVHNVRMWRFHNVIMDEAQDTNPCRRLFVRALLMPKGRAIFVGDSRQSIFGFTGADSDALDLCAREFNCIRLPLTITYRCPKAVVSFAHQWVSHIKAADTAPEGSVREMSLEAMLSQPALLDASSAVLSRNTKPLIELFFALLRKRIPCRVEGREVADGLKRLATRWHTIRTITALEDKLRDYRERETAKLLAKGKEEHVQRIEDTVGAILEVCKQCRVEKKFHVEDVVEYLDRMFDNNVTGMLVLSTIHRSKGREWKRVFWLDRANTCPSPYARTAEASLQEENLCYVAATRAKEVLIDVIVPHSRKH